MNSREVERRLHKINNIIFLQVLLVCSIIIVSPYLPEITYAFNSNFNKGDDKAIVYDLEKIIEIENTVATRTQVISTSTVAVEEVVKSAATLAATNSINQVKNVILKTNVLENNLYIPSISLVSDIKELSSIDELHTGSWRRPLTSKPGEGSNTVIIAHRYTSRGGIAGPNTFYHLPKVKVGDMIYVSYNSVLYKYEVFESIVVKDTDTYIESPTQESILTLYTCTPLWTSKDRHVVIAKLISPIINK